MTEFGLPPADLNDHAFLQRYYREWCEVLTDIGPEEFAERLNDYESMGRLIAGLYWDLRDEVEADG